MSDVQKLVGGAPTKSEILVNADQTTIVGDGSIALPLRAVGGGFPTTEHLEVGPPGGAVDASKDVSFVQYTGLIPEGSLAVAITLPDGTTDGQTKQVVLGPATNIIYTLTPDTFLGGNTEVDFVITVGGSAAFVWDAIVNGWWLTSSYGGTAA